MIVQLEKSFLYSTFGVDSFKQLESHIQTMAPSMVEYYLSDMASSLSSDTMYVNKSNIQQTLNIDEYSIYVDYNEDIYLEFTEDSSEYTTATLW